MPEVGKVYRSVMGRHFPAMTVVEVNALLEDEAKVEIEASAVVPHMNRAHVNTENRSFPELPDDS